MQIIVAAVLFRMVTASSNDEPFETSVGPGKALINN